MLTNSEQLNELFTALSKAQAMIKAAIKDSANPFFKSNYTSLDGCWEAARVPLTTNGLSIIQTIKEEGVKFYLITVLGHSSGQFISSTMPLLLAKNDPQSFGSACSYARRYSLSAIVGLTQGDDDDGEKAMVAHRIPSSKGGHARADALSPEERSQIASNAAAARWDKEELPDEEFYNKMFNYLPEYKDPSFGSADNLKDYLNSLASDHVPIQKIMKQALRNEEMTKRFCNSWLVWHQKIRG